MERIVLTHAGAVARDFSLHAGSFDGLKKRLSDGRLDIARATPYHFLSFLDNTKLLADLELVRDRMVSVRLKKVFVVGIGGANLASEAIINAFPKGLDREFIYIDTLYPGERADIVRMTASIKDKEECVIIVASKSGTTIETVTNAELLIAILEDRLGSISSRIVLITGHSSPLITWARHHKVTTVLLGNSMSDRFGVFSPLGSVPLLFSHLSVHDLFKGARHALDINLADELGPAWKTAIAIDKKMRKEKRLTLDFFFFSKRLETLGKWHRQLLAESLGKEKTISSKKNPYNLTPTVSVGTTDLHSMLQLYLAEPAGRFAWFVAVKGDFHRSVEERESFDSFLSGLAGNSPERTLGMIYDSITSEYADHDLPFVEATIDSITEESLGYLMMNAMIVTLALAQMWSVDAFTQPNVEHYKDVVRQEVQTGTTPVTARKVPLTIEHKR